MFSVLSTTPWVRFKLRPLMPVSFAGGDHQFTIEPTTGTCLSIPSDQSFSSDSLCKSAIAVSIPYYNERKINFCFFFFSFLLL